MPQQMLNVCDHSTSTQQASGKSLSQVMRRNVCNASSPKRSFQRSIEDDDGLEALVSPHARVTVVVTCGIDPDCKQLISIAPLPFTYLCCVRLTM